MHITKLLIVALYVDDPYDGNITINHPKELELSKAFSTLDLGPKDNIIYFRLAN